MLTGKINALNDKIHIEKLLIVKNDEINVGKAFHSTKVTFEHGRLIDIT